jgi:hypothetical protein
MTTFALPGQLASLICSCRITEISPGLHEFAASLALIGPQIGCFSLIVIHMRQGNFCNLWLESRAFRDPITKA